MLEKINSLSESMGKEVSVVYGNVIYEKGSSSRFSYIRCSDPLNS
ncbi:hypothetical protein BSM4216_3307 [Bacillus smithii]|nr:hypothetical protein BSM4216_3307 [Bacillus smithii]